MHRIRVVIAYQPGHQSRRYPYAIVREMFRDLGWPVVVAGGLEGDLYNCGQSKNAGVAQLEDPRADDVLVVADADCVTSEATLLQAVWMASHTPGVVWCGNQIRILDRDTTERLQSWREAAAQVSAGELRPCDATPQLYVIRRDAWDTLGGYDQSYVGYGFEDYDFRHRAAQRWPLRTAPGLLVHLWHQPDKEKVSPGSLYEANRARWEKTSGEPVPW